MIQIVTFSAEGPRPRTIANIDGQVNRFCAAIAAFPAGFDRVLSIKSHMTPPTENDFGEYAVTVILEVTPDTAEKLPMLTHQARIAPTTPAPF